MTNEVRQEEPKSEDEVFHYGDTGIASKHRKIPRWLWISYLILPFWGALWWYMFWNGSYGWFDRGYWQQLQRAANTTFPSMNLNAPAESVND